jgi:hypothetical protein
MALHLESVLLVTCHLSGAKNGPKIGKMLSIAAKDVLAR